MENSNPNEIVALNQRTDKIEKSKKKRFKYARAAKVALVTLTIIASAAVVVLTRPTKG